MSKLLRLCLCLAMIFSLCACGALHGDEQTTEDQTVWLNMNTEYPSDSTLPAGEGKQVKVILLLGQSNATGCSLTSYLKQHVGDAQYDVYEQGYESVRINFCLDDHAYSSGGAFVKTDLNCGAGQGCFGPELGMAEVLSAAFPDEQIFILKYSMSGYSLHHHWLCEGERGSIYHACMSFVTTHMQALSEAGYDARIGAICWMQGESDTTDYKAGRYLDNQRAFVSYLREDLAEYAEDGGIYMIDAGISNSPYCEPAYPAINEAKVKFSEESELNMYFSTIDAGYTVHKEPEGDPDWGHYDAESELALGRSFGRLVAESYERRQED